MIGHIVLMVLSLAAFACLALAMARHQRDLLQRALPPRATQQLRIGGWTLIAVALAWAIGWFGIGQGLAMLSAHTSVAAGAIVLAMVARERLR